MIEPAPVISAACAAAAALVLRPPWAWVRVRTSGLPAPRLGLGAAVGTVGAGAVGSVAVLPAAPTILAWTGAAIVATAWHRHRRSERRRRASRTRDLCQSLLDDLVGELRSGAAPPVAAARVVAERPGLGVVAAAATTGGDVAAAFSAAAAMPGAEHLGVLGRAWAISEATGAALGEVLDRVRAAAREDREIDREVTAAVAPARATATLMAAMPPLGLALGSGLGVDPVAVVTTTVAGAGCVALGTAFAIGGVTWIDAIADRAEGVR